MTSRRAVTTRTVPPLRRILAAHWTPADAGAVTSTLVDTGDGLAVVTRFVVATDVACADPPRLWRHARALGVVQAVRLGHRPPLAAAAIAVDVATVTAAEQQVSVTVPVPGTAAAHRQVLVTTIEQRNHHANVDDDPAASDAATGVDHDRDCAAAS